MEIKAELNPPYSDKEKLDFIVEWNHIKGYQIKYVETTYEYKVDVPQYEKKTITVEDYDMEGNPLGTTHEAEVNDLDNPIMTTTTIVDENGEEQEVEVQLTVEETREGHGIKLEAWGYTEKELQTQKQQQLDLLTLTPADVERALYKAKGMDFDDLKTLIAEKLPDIDTKALAIEFRAKDFYRGATLTDGTRIFDVVGALLGYTSDDMDYLFENKTLPVADTTTT